MVLYVGLHMGSQREGGVQEEFNTSSDLESSCEVGHSSRSHQVPQEELLSADVVHHLRSYEISKSLKSKLARLLAVSLHVPELSWRPCVWPRSSEASPLGAACRTQSLPGSPGHTAAEPSPPRWHPVLAASEREKITFHLHLQSVEAPSIF